MDQPRLIFNNQEIGLRKIGDDLYEPKNATVFKKAIKNDLHTSDIQKGFFAECPIPQDEPEDWRTIESFCFVATENIKEEAAVLLKSLRKFHDEPVYVLCDGKTRQFLNQQKLTENVTFRCGAEKEELDKVKKIFVDHKSVANKIHKPDCILKKMQVMELALENHENTFFLDSDIIVLESLQEYFQKKIALSPHYYPDRLAFSGFEYGFYNAGYVFCALKGFPKFWRKTYLSDSIFFEQECMNRIPAWYDIHTFNKSHNVGFWRREEIPDKIKTLHFHTKKQKDDNRTEELQRLNQYIKTAGINYMMDNGHEDIVSYINLLNKPRKIAFIHYGKAAGVYINKYFKQNILKGYKRYLSWDSKNNPFGISGRDWSEEELDSIAQTDEELCYITNHHINWNAETLKKFKDNGWFTFMFIRRPEEILCSLFFWARERDIMIRGPLPNPETLEEMFELALENGPFSKLWKLPDYVDDIDHVAEFNHVNFKDFLFDKFGEIYTPRPKENTSSNKGFCTHRVNGDISDKNAWALLKHPEYERYFDYLK